MSYSTPRITEKDIARYKSLYKARFGIELGEEEAARGTRELVMMVGEVYKPITKADAEDVDGDDNEQVRPGSD